MFKIGDKVIYTSGEYGSYKANPLHEDYPNVVGEITEVKDGENRPFPVARVKWSNGTTNGYKTSALELVGGYQKQKQELTI